MFAENIFKVETDISCFSVLWRVEPNDPVAILSYLS